MLKKSILALPFITAAMTASASTLSAVSCSEYSVSLTFASDITDAGKDVTKAGVGTSSSGPFTSFSSSSSMSVEGARIVTISLSDSDVIDLGPITSGGSCVVQVNSGFISGVTATSTRSE